MPFDIYSAEHFSALGLDSNAARILADGLRDEIETAVMKRVKIEITNVVVQLNSLGHQLAVYDDDKGAIAFRDIRSNGCHLRIAADLVISTGYAHTTECNAFDQDVRPSALRPHERAAARDGDGQ